MELYKMTWKEAIGGIPILGGRYQFQPFRVKRLRWSIEVTDLVLHKRFRFRKDESWLVKYVLDSWWKSIALAMLKGNGF